MRYLRICASVFTLALVLSAGDAVADEPTISFARGAEGDSYSVPASTVVRRSVDREDFIEELATQGIVLPEFSVGDELDVDPALTKKGRIERARQEVLEHAREVEPDEKLDLIVILEEIPFENADEVREMHEDAFRAALGQRRSRILDAQEDYVAHVLDHGEVVGQAHVINAIRVRVPAGRIERALAHPDVKAAYAGWQKIVPDYDGKQVRESTMLQSFIDAGFRGETGGRLTVVSNDNIKIGVMDVEPINTFHPGWVDWRGGPSRIVQNLNCFGGACSFASPSIFAGHGTWVTSIAAGSIEQGQSPTFPGSGTNDQRRRSGVAREAAVYYYQGLQGADVYMALDFAAVSGVDVFNMSFRISGCSSVDCDRSETCMGLNDLLAQVADLGLLVVKAASNQHELEDPFDCTVTYPGVRPEVVAVGNVFTSGSIDYDSALISADSSRGAMTVGMGGSWSTTFPGSRIPAIDIAAPGAISLYFSDYGLFSSVELSGTSFAAPVVAGAAGLLREALGLGSASAQRLKAVVLAMGDGTDVPLAGAGWEGGVSDTWGTGKLKAHVLGNLPGPSQYLIEADSLDESEEVRRAMPVGPLPAGVTQWKWVANVYHPSLEEVPWVAAEVRDACNGDVVLAGDYQFGPVKYLSLSAPRLQAGQCLEMRLYGISVAPGGVEVHSVAYYSSGDPDDH